MFLMARSRSTAIQPAVVLVQPPLDSIETSFYSAKAGVYFVKAELRVSGLLSPPGHVLIHFVERLRPVLFEQT
jgi:hypothetical protein